MNQKLPVRNPPMTASRLHQFVKSYESAFADWQLVSDEYFIRFEGPVAQVIGFEGLRSGAYRPANGIRILVAPNAAMQHQFLDIKHREVFATEHDQKKQKVIEAMEEQFTPLIRCALVPSEVLHLCESVATERTSDAYALSALNAACGNRERAIHWLDVLSRLTEKSDDELLDWEREYKEFGNELRHQLNDGRERTFLNNKREAETKRLLHGNAGTSDQ
jgi:hypothetical protein